MPPTPSFVSSLGEFSWCIYFKRTMDDDERSSEAMMRPKKSFPYPGPVQAAEKDGTKCVCYQQDTLDLLGRGTIKCS